MIDPHSCIDLYTTNLVDELLVHNFSIGIFGRFAHILPETIKFSYCKPLSNESTDLGFGDV